MSAKISRRIIRADVEDLIIVRKGEACTVSMPGVIASMDGSGFATNEQDDGSFLVSFVPGRNYFTVEAMKSGARNNLNVVIDGKVYVLVFQEADSNNLYSVIYSDHPLSLDEDPRPTPRKPISSGRLLSLLDKVKAYPMLSKDRPEIVQNLRVSFPYTVTTHENYDVRIRMVARDDSIDALAFELELIPRGDAPIAYDPEGFVVSVGGNREKGIPSRKYYQAIADATGRMEPHARNLAYFAIAGDGFGGRNNLDVFNRFEISVETLASRISPDPPIDPMPSDYAEGPKLPKPAPTPIPASPRFSKGIVTPAPALRPRPTSAPMQKPAENFFSKLVGTMRGQRAEPPRLATVDPEELKKKTAARAAATPAPSPAATRKSVPKPTAAPRADKPARKSATPVPTPSMSSSPIKQSVAVASPTAEPARVAQEATPEPSKARLIEAPQKATPVSTPAPQPVATPAPSPTPTPTPSPVQAASTPPAFDKPQSEIYQSNGVIQYDNQIELEVK
jgi:hypothetical protein